MQGEAILCLQGLTIRYGTRVVVERLDLQLRHGEVFGLLGPNGAGKSSTLRVLIGQQRASAGRILVAGLDVVRDWQAIKPLFGYVPDRDNHFPELTGRQNLRIFAGLYGVRGPRVEECLALLELSEAADVPVRAYSLGMRRKLLLARALLHRPQLLYLDEPTANLDAHSTALVGRVLRDLSCAGSTVLLTTHNLQAAEEICDRVGILSEGRLQALGSPRHLAGQRRDLHEAFLELAGAPAELPS